MRSPALRLKQRCLLRLPRYALHAMALPPRRFDATAMGGQGAELLSAVAFLLRRRASPPAARPPLDRLLRDILTDVPSLRSAAALRVWQLTTLFPGAAGDVWDVAAAQLGPAEVEGGALPADLQDYLAAANRPTRHLDALQVFGLAGALALPLAFFTPASTSDLGAGWLPRVLVPPRDLSLQPLSCSSPPLCLGVALGHAWALEHPVSPHDLWGPGSPDVTTDLLRLAGALPSISSPPPSCLSLLAAAQGDAGASSSDSDGFHFRDQRRGPGTDLPSPSLRHSPSPPTPPASPGTDEAEHLEQLLALEAAEVHRHVVLRSLFGDVLRDSSAAFHALGRLP